MSGAVLGRFAGCTLGCRWKAGPSPYERAGEIRGDGIPSAALLTAVECPWGVQYDTDRRIAYTWDGMDGVPVDDDITYTILGLLILEKYGFDFTTADVGAYWKAHLPVACTAEKVALENLKAGIPRSGRRKKETPMPSGSARTSGRTASPMPRRVTPRWRLP